MKLKFIPYILFFLLAASCQEKGSKPDTIQQEYKPHIIDLSEAEYSEEPQLLSDFVESIEYIKFSEEPLIPDLVLHIRLRIMKEICIWIAVMVFINIPQVVNM